MTQKQTQSAFTIVELLIVIVVIGILAALVMNSFSGAQEKARQAKIDSDLTALEKAIMTARVAEGGATMAQITGSNATGGACWSKPTGTDLSALPSSDGCWVSYRNALAAISNKSGSNVNDLVDPWGYPYFIDENEQEYSSNPCREDTIGTFNRPIVNGAGNSRNQYRHLTFVSTDC